MYKENLINTINFFIKILLTIFIFSSIWFIVIKDTLVNPETYDIRILSGIIMLTLLLAIVKFLLTNIITRESK